MTIPSPHINEVRWTAIKALVPADFTDVDVVVVDRQGTEHHFSLEITERWAGRGWQRLFACPRCYQPRAVLRLQHDQLLCNRCIGHRWPSQREHRARTWHDGGHVAATLIGRVQRGDAKPKTVLKLAEQLLGGDMERVAALAAQVEGTE